MKKNICFIISGTGYSGAEIVLNRYLENNYDVNPSFIILFKNSEIEKIYKSIYGDDKVKSLNIIYNKSIYRFTIPIYMEIIRRKLNEYFKRNNPELIYVNNTSEGILCSKFISYINKNTILHIHDMRESYSHPYNNYIIKKYFKNYNKIITVSNATKKSWNGLEMEVVYNGLQDCYFEDIKNINFIKEIAFIGSLNKRKGADYLINSINNLLIKTDVNITFAFKDYEDKLLEKLESINNIRVRILRNLNEKQIKELYSNIDLLIVPSRLDPLPTVIMEAEAKGRIVLGNKSSGIIEMINVENLLVEINDESDLENAIIKLTNTKKEILNKYQKLLHNHSISNFKSDNKKIKINEIINQLT